SFVDGDLRPCAVPSGQQGFVSEPDRRLAALVGSDQKASREQGVDDLPGGCSRSKGAERGGPRNRRNALSSRGRERSKHVGQGLASGDRQRVENVLGALGDSAPEAAERVVGNDGKLRSA